jgi:lipoprotein-anchoring transpeptidase ErfK/SrfK
VTLEDSLSTSVVVNSRTPERFGRGSARNAPTTRGSAFAKGSPSSGSTRGGVTRCTRRRNPYAKLGRAPATRTGTRLDAPPDMDAYRPCTPNSRNDSGGVCRSSRAMADRSGWVAGLAALAFTTAVHASQAWINSDRANIRFSPSAASPVIGRVERGDHVDVVDDEGEPPQGWTLLRPFGAIRTRLLVPVGPTSDERPVGYIYGRVIVPSAAVRVRPVRDARIVGRNSRRQILAFKNKGDDAGGWLERPDGTFVARSEVKLLVGSEFRGVFDPPPTLAFVLRRVRVQPTDDPMSPETVLERYATLPVLSVGRKVRTSKGDLPRSAVRLAHSRNRPSGIGSETRWVHVDTTEQVLTAYEGDRLVFATLVSTGKPGWETPLGQFRSWLKLRHGEMRGHRAAYLVEEVPDALFFGSETALHGAIWHDRFGSAVTHGCVNLSPADAQWLFQWAPPSLPDGWHGILPGTAGLESLWVVIEAGDAEPKT